MLLAVDIGNTNITLGLFDKNKLVKTFSLSSHCENSKTSYAQALNSELSTYTINCCFISSVCDEALENFKSAIEDNLKVKTCILSASSFKNMKISVPNPNSVGIDRLVDAYAVKYKYNFPAIVVDIGTAITFDIISKNGDFTGGIIMPGLNMKINSLYTQTSKLPLLKLENVKNIIGNSTESSILSGVVIGTACEIDGIIEKLQKELGKNVQTILTGGQSEFIKPYLKNDIIIDQYLTLEGINIAANEIA